MIAPEQTFSVVWPGARATPQEQLLGHAGLQQLDGKTVAFVWDYMFRGDEMFELVARQIASQATGVRFIGPDVFGDIHGPEEREVVSALADRMRQYAVDAAIVGVGA